MGRRPLWPPINLQKEVWEYRVPDFPQDSIMLHSLFRLCGTVLVSAVMVAAYLSPAAAHSYCGAPRSGPQVYLFGEPGDFALLTRTVRITMRDMRFSPDHVAVKQGESIRFIVTNLDDADHDFTLGDEMTQQEHRKEMAEMTDIAAAHANHSDAHAIFVPAGKTRVLIWTFSVPGSFEFDCNMPGHYEAGMRGDVSVR